MRNRMKNGVCALTIAMVLGLIAMPVQMRASEEGRRNTAYALGAATIFFIAKKRPVEALIAGGATAVAAKSMQDKINARHRRERQRASSRSYSSGYSAGSRTASGSGSSAAFSKGYRAGYNKGLSVGFNQGVSAGYKKGLAAAVRQQPARNGHTQARTRYASV